MSVKAAGFSGRLQKPGTFPVILFRVARLARTSTLRFGVARTPAGLAEHRN